MTKQLNNFFEENYIRNLQFDSFETDIAVLSSNSYKLVSKIYNNIVVLSKISFSNKYTLKDFINDDKEYREKPISKLENSNQIDLLQHYIDLRYEMIKELEIISSITTTLNKTLVEDSSVNCSLFTLNIYENVLEKVPKRSSLFITNQLYDYDLQKFLFDLNHLFISQFNIQGISEITTSSIVQCLRNFIDDNNKSP
ncbi:972_t:CDS:2 [Gigaspora rosea]|nr:972_t:CDS:2 [Gigaspora rosea]